MDSLKCLALFPSRGSPWGVRQRGGLGPTEREPRIWPQLSKYGAPQVEEGRQTAIWDLRDVGSMAQDAESIASEF